MVPSKDLSRSCMCSHSRLPPVANDNVVDWEGAGDWTTSAFLNALAEADCLRLSDMTEDV